MTIRVGINGFGRIGRNYLRALSESAHNEEIVVVAINDISDAATNVHLLKYDSVLGPFKKEVTLDGSFMVVDGERIALLSERRVKDIPWQDYGVDVVIEATGIFTSKDSAGAHDVEQVIVTAPASGADLTVVYGINHEDFRKGEHRVISNASCTTNCLAPMLKVVQDNWGIERGSMTTIHAYTNDQSTLDYPHKDLRRARAAAINMIPTSTGAAKAVGLVLPELEGKIDGYAMRVPVPTGSATDLTLILSNPATAEEVNKAFKEASVGALAGVLAYTEDLIVSSDIVTNPASSIIDAGITKVDSEGTLLKVLGWYDNEWGYSNRLLDLTAYVA